MAKLKRLAIHKKGDLQDNIDHEINTTLHEPF